MGGPARGAPTRKAMRGRRFTVFLSSRPSNAVDCPHDGDAAARRCRTGCRTPSAAVSVGRGGKPSVEFRILGPLEMEGAAGEIRLGSGKQRALLALLLLHANDVVPAPRLVELLWPEGPPADSAKALQVHVSRLRRALGEEQVIQTRPGGYLLAADARSFDLPRFEEHAERGARPPRRG